MSLPQNTLRTWRWGCQWRAGRGRIPSCTAYTPHSACKRHSWRRCTYPSNARHTKPPLRVCVLEVWRAQVRTWVHPPSRTHGQARARPRAPSVVHFVPSEGLGTWPAGQFSAQAPAQECVRASVTSSRRGGRYRARATWAQHRRAAAARTPLPPPVTTAPATPRGTRSHPAGRSAARQRPAAADERAWRGGARPGIHFAVSAACSRVSSRCVWVACKWVERARGTVTKRGHGSHQTGRRALEASASSTGQQLW